MEYSTYLFDFDYTLADSSRGIVICFRNVLARHGHTHNTDEDIKRTIGKTLEESFGILTGITNAETLAGYKAEYIKEADTYMTANTQWFPETKPVLEELKKKGAKIGIISTKFRFRINEMLDMHFPKGFFDIVIGGEDVTKAKPHPQGLKKALRRLHRLKRETLYIGDSTVDAEAARRAGIDFVGVLNGMTTRDELAAYPHRKILDNLLLLPRIQKHEPYKAPRFLPPKLLATYRLARQKQIRGKKDMEVSINPHICKNCGTSFTGNYCPRCGQTKNTPRFTIRNAFQNILSGFFNIDNGFSRNLLELVYRPGYMIRDYLKGKRVHYFKPFQSLFVLAALYIMAVQLIDPQSMKKPEEPPRDLTYEEQHATPYEIIKKELDENNDDGLIDELIDGMIEAGTAIIEAWDNAQSPLLADNSFGKAVVDLMSSWVHGNKAFSILALLPIFTLSTRWTFRRTPVGRQLNITEHFFAQVYIACQILWISLLLLPFTGKANLNDIFDLSTGTIFLLYVWDNRQLFDLPWWKSLKRTTLMFLNCFLLVLFTSIAIIALLVWATYLLDLAK